MSKRLIARIYLPEEPATVAAVLEAYSDSYCDLQVTAMPLIGTNGVLEIHDLDPYDGEDE